MSEAGFLENLYQGRYSKSLGFPYAGSPDEKKIHDL